VTYIPCASPLSLMSLTLTVIEMQSSNLGCEKLYSSTRKQRSKGSFFKALPPHKVVSMDHEPSRLSPHAALQHFIVAVFYDKLSHFQAHFPVLQLLGKKYPITEGSLRSHVVVGTIFPRVIATILRHHLAPYWHLQLAQHYSPRFISACCAIEELICDVCVPPKAWPFFWVVGL
jgi:hypothetical protein